LGVGRELLGGADNESFLMLGDVADGNPRGVPASGSIVPDSGSIIAARGGAAQGEREHQDGQPSD
jgi:hypothetical protein